jgi:hypothetical protein
MGSAAFEFRMRVTGDDQVSAAMLKTERQAKQTARTVTETSEAFGGMSHSALIGIGELSRGIGRVAEAGEVGAFAMREFTGAAFRLGESLGPAGGLIAITLLLGHAFYEVFSGARKQMEETRKKFEEEIGKMANAGQSTQLQQNLRDKLYGTPYSTNAKGEMALNHGSAFVAGAFQGSLLDLQGQQAFIEREMMNANQFQKHMLEKQLDDLKKKIAPLLKERDQITAAILNVANQPQTMTGMLPSVTTAQAPSKNSGWTQALIDKYAGKAEGILRADDWAKLGVQVIGGGIGMRQIDHKGLIAAAKIDPSAADDAAKNLIETWVKPMASMVQNGIAETLGAGIKSGIAAAFEKGANIGKIGASLTSGVLGAFGDMFEQIGQMWVSFGVLKSVFHKSLVDPFESGAAAIAAGLGLIALGATLHGVGGRIQSNSAGGYGGNSSSAPPSIIDRGVINPTGSSSTPAIVNHNYFVGVNDPVAQRALVEMYDKGKARS